MAYKQVSFTEKDQERIQRVIDHMAAQGVDLEYPGAVRVALSAWENANLPKPAGTVPSMDQDPEANKRWQDREIDRQQNPLEYEK